jgi:hypothetical protein
MEFGNALPYDIKISGSHNKGFIVKAGCCIAIFTEKEKLLEAIGEYIDDPKGMEKKYNESDANRTQEVENAPNSDNGTLALRNDVEGENCEAELRQVPNSRSQEDQCEGEFYPDRRR